MNAETSLASFQMLNNDGLRAMGLAGEHVWGALRDGALTLHGDAGGAADGGDFVLRPDTGGALRIAAADVVRLRVGYGERNGLQYRTVIWRAGHVQPLRLCPSRQSWNPYTQTIRGFAATVAGHGGMHRVEAGSSIVEAIGPNLLAIVPLAGLWLLLDPLIIEWGWARLLAPIALLALLIGLIKWRSSHWPRRIRDLSSLQDVLPGTNNTLLPPFQMAIGDGLIKLGLAGDNVWATLRNGALELEGDKGSVARDGVLVLRREEGGCLRIAASDVTRLSVGYFESRYAGRSYMAAICRSGVPEPVKLAPHNHQWEAYSQTMHAFAARIAEQGGMQRIETGLSKLDALLAPVLIGLLALGAIGISLFALTHEPWWGRLLVPVFPVALFLVFLKSSGRHWPRPIRTLADLDGLLPPVFNGKATFRDKLFILFGGRRR